MCRLHAAKQMHHWAPVSQHINISFLLTSTYSLFTVFCSRVGFEHRKDSFITHRAFCDALAQENTRITSVSTLNHYPTFINNNQHHHFSSPPSSLLFQPNFDIPAAVAAVDPISLDSNFPSIVSDHGGDVKPCLPALSSPQLPLWLDPPHNPNPFFCNHSQFLQDNHHPFMSEPLSTTYAAAPHMSATALLQTAAQMGHTRTPPDTQPILFNTSAAAPAAVAYGMNNSAAVLSIMGGAKEEMGGQNLTRDFLGVGNQQLMHLTPVGSNQYNDQSRRH